MDIITLVFNFILLHHDLSISIYVDLSICTFISNRRDPFSRFESTKLDFTIDSSDI